jgi:hypothetical protein
MRLNSLLKRLFGKIVHDVLPTALASILGGLLLTHFQVDRTTQPVPVKVTPASPEMMQLLRDEHGAIVSFAKEQAASERNRGVAEQEPRRSVAEAAPASRPQAVPAPAAPRPNFIAVAASKPTAVHGKNSVVGGSLPAPAATLAQATGAVTQPAARTDDSLLAKTLGIKDRVVSVTQRAASATVGVIPSWFGSVGDRIGGEGQSSRPPADLVNASWMMSAAADR